jgi:segregation and condensation protein B
MQIPVVDTLFTEQSHPRESPRMSLQAKIEAVIYASEEPVTLAQLVGLLGEEAQAELDVEDAQQASLALSLPLEGEERGEDAPAGEAPGDEDALNAEVLDNPGLGELDATDESRTDDAISSAALRNDKEGSETPEAIAAPEAQTQDAGSAPQRADALAGDRAPGASESVPGSGDDKKAAREKERRLRDYFRTLLDRLIAEYANSDRGLEIREVAGGFRMATKPEYHDAVRGFVKSLKPPLKLSLQALETLAVIAYKQPVTAPEISEIRGVESGGVLGTLMARKLIGTAGRKAVIGRPMLYKTTKEFLVRFGLKDINELPSIEEFEKMAGELVEPVQEEIPMEQAGEDTAPAEGAEFISGDGSPVLDELNTAPASNTVSETPEEMMSDKQSAPDGAATEPSSGASADAVRQVEQMAGVHEAQPDGDSTPTAEAQENPGSDAIVDGRISGVPPRADAEETDNLSAQEAREQQAGGGE